MSGSLFTVSLDPLIRRLGWQRTLASARLLAFADDLASVLHSMRASLPALFATLRRWQAASGLALKESKCVFIPLGENMVS